MLAHWRERHQTGWNGAVGACAFVVVEQCAPRLTPGVHGESCDVDMSALTVSFGLPENGWISLELRAGAESLDVTFSHIYPALRELCSALCDFVNEAPPRPVVFLLEPEELELRILSRDGQHELRVTRFPDRLRTSGSTLLEFKTTRQELTLVLWRALRRLETALPGEDFAARFRDAFPALEMTSLTELIREKRRRWSTAEDGAG